MSPLNSHPPFPVDTQQAAVLPPSSIFSTPSFSSTLPLPRPASASDAPRHNFPLGKRRSSQSSRRRRTRSVASSISASSDGSLGDFSMENYTIDLAELAKGEGEARKTGSTVDEPDLRKEDQGKELRVENQPKETKYSYDSSEDEQGDLMGDYTIDLGGLGDKPSSIVVEDRAQDGEEIPSEDEGPNDFTLNMEKLMRENQAWNKQQQSISPNPKPGREDLTGNEILEIENENAIGEESIFEPLVTSTPRPQQTYDLVAENLENETKLQAPPLSRLNTEKLQDQAAEEVFERISALQAEVERMRLEDSRRQTANQDLEREKEQLRNENEAMLQKLKERRQDPPQDFATTKSSSPISKADSAAQELAITKEEVESDRIEADAKIQVLERQLQISRQEAQALEADLEAKQKASNLESNILHNELEEERVRVDSLRANFEGLENETFALRESLVQKDNIIRNKSDDARVARTELDHAQEQFRESRRIMETVEGENDRLIQENERQAQDIKEVGDLLESKATELQAAHIAIAKLRDAPNVVEPNLLASSTAYHEMHKAALQDIRQQHESALSSISAQHAHEMDTIRSALKKVSEGVQKGEARFSKTHKEQVFELHQQIAEIKQQKSIEQMSTQTEERENTVETQLRSAIDTLSGKLERADAAVVNARAEAQAAQQRAEEIQQTNEMTNAELETRFAEAVEAREREWTKRVSLLFRERDKMSHVLLHGWGKEEMGPVEQQERQAYKYKYVKGRF